MCCCVFYIIVRGVAQLVARLVRVQKAVGSSPVTPTKKPFMPYPGVSGFFDAEGRGIEQAACLCMGWAVLWLGHRLGEMLPALLCLSGMKNGIEWLGFYPLFHAASLLQIQGYNALGNEYSYSGFAFFWLAAALCFSWVLYWDLVYAYECKGQ